MEWLISNWYVIVGLLAVAFVCVFGCIEWVKLPSATQIENIKEWLKWAVTEAESALGSGTGQLKLRMVYDMATTKFPWLVKFVSFKTFSEWVDVALEWMKSQFENNPKITEYINGATKE